MSRKIWNQWNRFWDDCVCSEYKYLHHFFSDFPFPSGKMMAKPRIQFQFCVSVHHIMINKNTSLMQLISIYFTYSRSLHVSGRTLPISSPTTQPLPHSNIFYPLDASSTSFNGLIPIADMYSIIFSWWWAVSCPKHVETYYKWNIYLLAASSWCSYLSLQFNVLITIFLTWRNSPQWAKASSLSRMITLRHTTLDRTAVDEWSARRRDLYMTTHNSYNRQTSMPTAGLEPTVQASERLQTNALDRAATGIGHHKMGYIDNNEQLIYWKGSEPWLHRTCPYIWRYHDSL